MGNSLVEAAAKASSSSGNSSLFLLALVGIVVVMYLVFMRPQRNRQRKIQESQRNVGPGARVRTTAGMYATVVAVDGDDVVLEPSPGVQMRFMRRSIMEVLAEDAEFGDPGDEEYAPGEDEDEEFADDGTDGAAAGDLETDVTAAGVNGTNPAAERAED